MRQKVCKFCSDGYILKKPVQIQSYLQTQNAYLKTQEETRIRNKPKKKPFSILQCRVDPMLSSVFWNENTHLSEIFFSIFLNLRHIPNITTVKKIF